MFVLRKIKRLSMYSTLRFDLKSALGGAPLDAVRKKATFGSTLIKKLRALKRVTQTSDHALQ